MIDASGTGVGFVGLGNMGRPMAARLVARGFAVRGVDGRRDVSKGFARDFGTVEGSLAAAAAASDVLITMLPTSAVVGTVLGEALPHLREGSVILEMSSGEPGATVRLAQTAAEAGCSLMDAPVSGGVPRARTGELAVMVGGDPGTLERVRPVLDAMATSIMRTGGVGSAHAMKALNNLVSAAGFIAAVEALLAGSRFGLDPGLMVDVLNASTGMNDATRRKLKQFVLSRRFDSGFGLDLLVKDLGIALGVARGGDTPAPLSALCRELALAARTMVGPGRDHTELALLWERLAGTELLPGGAPP